MEEFEKFLAEYPRPLLRRRHTVSDCIIYYEEKIPGSKEWGKIVAKHFYGPSDVYEVVP